MNDWNDILGTVPQLDGGSHAHFGPELCFMEMTAFLAGEPHSDHPQCACPVLTNFGISLNDRSQAWRDALTPIVPLMIGTRNPALEAERLRYLIFNLVRRVVVPAIRPKVGDELADAILAATNYESLRDAADAADAAVYAAAAYAADAADAAVYAADAANAAADAIPTTIDIFREAIALDPNHTPAALDMGRVKQLQALV